MEGEEEAWIILPVDQGEHWVRIFNWKRGTTIRILFDFFIFVCIYLYMVMTDVILTCTCIVQHG